MTVNETRQLGIEFERRVQTMIPEKEVIDKLDSDTIYSFLNQYQDKYVHDIYRSLDQIPSGTKLSAHVEAVLQAMLKSETIMVGDNGVINQTSSSLVDPNGIRVMDTGRSVIYPLPETYYMYVRSVSSVTSTFSFKSAENNQNNTSIRVVPNELVSQNDAWKLIETPHNTLRILRHPAAVLSEHRDDKPTLTVIYDQYTTPVGIKVLYYAEPQHFNVMTSTPCELPMDVFDDLVSGAVDLYVQYVAGAEARKKQMQEAARQQQKENNKRRNNEDD